jgi:polysaccharide export outer membrane protein
VGVSDVLEIAVFGVPDLSRTVRVNSSGTIRLPFLGELQVNGLTPGAIEQKIAQLLEGKYVNNPQVSVIVKEPRSKMYSVMGAVRSPGQYQMLDRITLMTALTTAGGLDLSRAGDRVVIQRTSPNAPVPQGPGVATSASGPAGAASGSGSSLVIDLNLNQLWEQGDRSLDLPIEPGDIINIPEKVQQSFYIIGDVHGPGRFVYPDKGGIKLSLAVAMAGGPTRDAKLNKTMLLRQLPDGKRQEIAINLHDVLKGKSRDIDLQPNDLVFVPGSTAKNIAYGLLGLIPSTAQSTIYTVTR